MTRVWVDYITNKLGILALSLFLIGIVSVVIFGLSVVVGIDCGYFVIPFMICTPLAFVASIVTLILCLFSSKVFSGSFLMACITLLLSVFPVFLLYGVHLGVRARAKVYKTTGEYKLEQLGTALKKYAKKHNGKLPQAEVWCDQLLADGQELTDKDFLHPRGNQLGLKGKCHFAFNKNLGEMQLTDIPGDVVLLFEADGDWNLSGGVELLQTRYRQHNYIIMFFADGSMQAYWFDENSVRRFDSKGTQMHYAQPRWYP